MKTLNENELKTIGGGVAGLALAGLFLGYTAGVGAFVAHGLPRNRFLGVLAFGAVVALEIPTFAAVGFVAGSALNTVLKETNAKDAFLAYSSVVKDSVLKYASDFGEYVKSIFGETSSWINSTSLK